jgi:hypothetical protein
MGRPLACVYDNVNRTQPWQPGRKRVSLATANLTGMSWISGGVELRDRRNSLIEPDSPPPIRPSPHSSSKATKRPNALWSENPPGSTSADPDGYRQERHVEEY